MSVPLRKDDPAYWMLQKGYAEQYRIDNHEITADEATWITPKDIHKDGCYICEDPEFALMGLPLCKPCPLCGAHWAADDGQCDNECAVDGWYIDGQPEDFAIYMKPSGA